MKKHRSTPILPFLTRQLAIPLLVLWLLSMSLMTWAAAKDFYRQMDERTLDWLQASRNISTDPDDLPGLTQYDMLDNLGFGYMLLSAESLFPIMLPHTPSSMGNHDWLWGKWELVYGYQAALTYFDAQGQPLISSGDYVYFSYSFSNDGEEKGYAYTDLSLLEGGATLANRYISSYPMGDFFPFFTDKLIFTGYLEDARFTPVSIFSLSGTVQENFPENLRPGQDPVTLYTVDTRGYNYEPGSPFRLDGKTYDTPVPLTHTKNFSQRRFGLLNSVIVYSAPVGEEYHCTAAVQFNPLAYAMLRMCPAYVVSLLGVVLCLLWCRKRTRKFLTEPLSVINRSYEHNRVELSYYANSPLMELQALGAHFNDAQQDRHEAHNKIQQLNTALNYAKDAEENRRKMISAIAHELKTPLAIVHSYAEGLQTGIAADKQEKYLSVILEETEHMDSMVLEMLDLSRLEAGKVHLSSDRFSLQALTRAVFDRMALAVQAKDLQLEYQFCLDFTVTADEARISQVITNFASNAVKYTPEGGKIRVQIYQYDGAAHFIIENDSPPLSEQALAQVWDSFYRADSARSGGGTGLGLAIAKNIIELHRGSCAVRNTEHGVEFRFRIPF